MKNQIPSLKLKLTVRPWKLMLGRLRIPFRDAIVSGAMIVMSVISWDAEPDSPRIPVNHKDRFLGSPIPHCWWFHKKSGKFTPSPLEGRLVVYIYIYIPSLKPEFLTSPVWFFGVFRSFSTQFPDTSAGLPFRWFDLVVPLKELSSKIFETHYERTKGVQRTKRPAQRHEENHQQIFVTLLGSQNQIVGWKQVSMNSFLEDPCEKWEEIAINYNWQFSFSAFYLDHYHRVSHCDYHTSWNLKMIEHVLTWLCSI